MKNLTLKTLTLTLGGLLAAGLAPIALAASASHAGAAPPAYTALAAEASAAGKTHTTLFFQEQAMVQSVGQPAVFGPTAGRYWQSIKQSDNWGRAYDFFARLKAEHPDDPNVLANYGDSIGALMGSLPDSYAKKLPSSFFSTLNKKAMQAYAHSLKLQPDNFAALFGRSIYLSYTPGGMGKAKAGFKHILSLRKSHPHYPYALVYRQWAAALKRHGKPQQAKKVMQQGKAKLGAAAFSQGSHTNR